MMTTDEEAPVMRRFNATAIETSPSTGWEAVYASMDVSPSVEPNESVEANGQCVREREEGQ